MTAIVLPDLDRSTIESLKERMPTLHLSEIELPSMEHAGQQADRALDRLLGRSRPTIWPWVAAALGIAAIVGTVAAFMSWSRRPSWSSWQSRDRGSLGNTGVLGGSGVGGSDTGIGMTTAYGEARISTSTDVTGDEEPLP